MAFNVNNFRANGLKLGGARPSLFEVTITPPAGVGAPGGVQRIPFLVRAAQLPAMTVDPVEVPYFGRKIKLAGDRTFADWTVTVMNDEDFQLRSLFENWSNKINSIVGNVGSTPPNAYKTTAAVSQFGRTAGSATGPGPLIRQYTFNGLFPTNIDAIALDWDTTNTIETFDVTFSYDWWEPANGLTTDSDTIDIGAGSQQLSPANRGA
jgi:hypothetical protein